MKKILKNKKIIIISISLIILIAVSGVIFYNYKNKNKIIDIIENNSIITLNQTPELKNINKIFKINNYNINYDNLNKKEKEYLTKTLKLDLVPSIVLKKDNQLSKLSEISILDFYLKNEILTKEKLNSYYLKDIDFTNSIIIIINNNLEEKTINTVKEYLQSKNIKNQFINLDEIKKPSKYLLLDYLKLDRNEDKEMIVYLKNKEFVNKLEKFATEDDIKKFLLKNNLIEEEKEEISNNNSNQTPNKKPQPSTPSKDNSSNNQNPSQPIKPSEPNQPSTPVVPSVFGFIEIDANKYAQLIQTNNVIIIAGKDGCGYCQAAIPVLKKIAAEQKIAIYYLNLSISSNTTNFWGSINGLPNSFGTPFTMIVSNKTLKASISQKYLENDYLTFFRNNGLI